MNKCICCHGRLIKYLSHHRMYWFCPSCYQEMPAVDEIKACSLKRIKRKVLSS